MKRLKLLQIGKISSVGEVLDWRAEGREFDSQGRRNTQSLKITANGRLLPLLCKWLDFRVARMTK